jgi:hypothetical protein
LIPGIEWNHGLDGKPGFDSSELNRAGFKASIKIERLVYLCSVKISAKICVICI